MLLRLLRRGAPTAAAAPPFRAPIAPALRARPRRTGGVAETRRAGSARSPPRAPRRLRRPGAPRPPQTAPKGRGRAAVAGRCSYRAAGQHFGGQLFVG